MALLFLYGVDIVLQAHEHGYERSKQLLCAKPGEFISECVIDDSNSMTQNGTVIVVLGTGGMVFVVNLQRKERGFLGFATWNS